MVSLKELLDYQKVTGCSDMEVIRLYFVQNNIEEKGTELVYELSQSRIGKLKTREKYAKGWINMLPSRILYEDYGIETADMLHNLELNFITNGGEGLSNHFLKWAENNVPNIIRPKAYFNPLVEWMKERGIEFKPRGCKV